MTRRTAPSGSAGNKVGELGEGDQVLIHCQVQGQAVTSSVLGKASSVWAQLDDGSYVAQAYLDSPLSIFTVDRPC